MQEMFMFTSILSWKCRLHLLSLFIFQVYLFKIMFVYNYATILNGCFDVCVHVMQ